MNISIGDSAVLLRQVPRILASVFIASLAASSPALSADALVHDFSGLSGEGITPIAPVVLDSSGFLYGTTQNLGAFSAGTVFKVRTDGSAFSVLHGFPSTASEGDAPAAGLTFDGVDTLYGTTQFGGTSNLGTVFRIKTDGSGFTTLYSFSGGALDGSNPVAAVVLDGSGFLYGTTELGGTSGIGLVFKMTTDGNSFSILHSFDGVPTDGDTPVAALALDASGNLFGTTQQGGMFGFGTIFTIKTDGTGYAKLTDFAGGLSDGGLPAAPLTFGPGLSLFGTTTLGGAFSSGTVFKMQTDGTGFATLHNFGENFLDPSTPVASVTLDSSGNLRTNRRRPGSAVFKMRSDGPRSRSSQLRRSPGDGAFRCRGSRGIVRERLRTTSPEAVAVQPRNCLTSGARHRRFRLGSTGRRHSFVSRRYRCRIPEEAVAGLHRAAAVESDAAVRRQCSEMGRKQDDGHGCECDPRHPIIRVCATWRVPRACRSSRHGRSPRPPSHMAGSRRHFAKARFAGRREHIPVASMQLHQASW